MDQYGIKYMEQHALLIKDIASAYNQKRLSKGLSIDGILPCDPPFKVEDILCPWKSGNEVDYYNDSDKNTIDKPCECCKAICSFFPIEQVFQLEDYQLPCTRMKFRTETATRRAPAKAKKFLSIALRNALVGRLFNPSHSCIMYGAEQIDRIKFFISQGAETKDPTLREIVLACKDSELKISYMTEEPYYLFTELGIIRKSDFKVLSEKDLKEYPRFN